MYIQISGRGTIFESSENTFHIQLLNDINLYDSLNPNINSDVFLSTKDDNKVGLSVEGWVFVTHRSGVQEEFGRKLDSTTALQGSLDNLTL